MALSAGGDRIWVVSSGGLAIARVDDRRRQSWPAQQPIDIMIHPTREIVWCRRVVPSECMCGRHLLTSQFDLATGKWHDVPESGDCPHVAPWPEHYCAATDRLWFSHPYDPPKVYDLRTGKTRTWPRQPNWEKLDGRTVVYSDRFGQMLAPAGGQGEYWFATAAGLWRYDESRDRWESHRWIAEPRTGQPVLVRSGDGKTSYWACDRSVAAFDVAANRWTMLWSVPPGATSREGQRLLLSPDGRFLWWMLGDGVFVGDLETKQAGLLIDAAEPGLSSARTIKFDEVRKLAVIATRRGIVCADYSGRLRFAIQRNACPIMHVVSRFVFAPDGSETWCLTEGNGGLQQSAAIYYPRQRRWEELPDARTGGHLIDVAFAKDGRTTWISLHENESKQWLVREHTQADRRWSPIRAKMPKYYGEVERFGLTPAGDELWLNNTGCGLLRVKLASGAVSQYVKADYRRHELAEMHELAENYVKDLVFTPDGKFALCSATGGGDNGLTLIDLTTGRSQSFPVDMGIERMALSPDGSTAWCIFNNSKLWAFDVAGRQWGRRLDQKSGLPFTLFRTLVVSPCGRFVWIRSGEGAAVLSFESGQWKTFAGPEWRANEWSAPLLASSDGKHVVCGYERGVAIIDIDGSNVRVVPAGPEQARRLLTHAIPIPGSMDVLCAISPPASSAIYRLDVARRTLTKLADLSGPATALAIGPDKLAWVGLPGGVVCLDPTSGMARDVTGEPPAQAVRPIDARPAQSDRITVAPPEVGTAQVTKHATTPPTLPDATHLKNEKLLWESTHVPLIADSTSGKIYVLWFARPRDDAAAPVGGVPLIGDELLDPVDKDDAKGVPGVTVFDGKAWRQPQLLVRGNRPCIPCFAWCVGEDLHLLAEMKGNSQLHHLVYRPADGKWACVAVVDGFSYPVKVVQSATSLEKVHLADRRGRSIIYCMFDGASWSKPVTIPAAADDASDVSLLADDRDVAYLAWAETHGKPADKTNSIAWAIVRDGHANVSRGGFRDRFVARDDFAFGLAPSGEPMVVYRTKLPENHADANRGHIRRWTGHVWQSPLVIPFGTSGFGSPILTRRGRNVLLTWVHDYPAGAAEAGRLRSYSILGPDDTWSAPQPVGRQPGEGLMIGHFMTMHVDRRGRVHAAWQVGNYHMIFASLGG